MRFTISKRFVAIAASGLVVVALAGCAETSTSGSSSSSAASSSAAAPVTTPTPVANIPALSGVHTQVILDAGFLKALTTLKLTPGVIGTATLKAGTLTFPITGGNVKYFDPKAKYRPYVQGKIDHQGSGISLTAGKTKVSLENFTIDPGASKLYGDVLVNGKTAATQAYLFHLNGATLKPLVVNSDGTAVLEGTQVVISPDAAALLNKTFGTTAVTDTLLVGIAKITVNTK
jgi:hypothetical protein